MLYHQDIQNQQFNVRFRGFDTEEVDEFLEQAAATVQKLTEENRELKEQLEAAHQQVAELKEQEKSTLGAIVSAQSVAQEMKEKAQDEAREVVAKAREEANRLKENASAEILALEREVDRLQGIKTRVRDEIRQVLESYLTRLDADHDESSTGAPRSKGRTDSGAEAGLGAGVAATATDDELFQSIELSDDLLPPMEDLSALARGPAPSADLFNPGQPAEGSAAASSFESTTANDGDDTLPDLEDDLIFNLEDPLDDEHELTLESDELDQELLIDFDDEPDQEQKQS